MNDGERLAPVTLAREEPVAELVLRLRLADTLGLKPCDHLRLSVLYGKAGNKAGVDHYTRGNISESDICDVGNSR